MIRMSRWTAVFALLIFGVQVRAASCESIGSLSLPQTTVILARSVPAGAFALSTNAGGNVPAALMEVASKDLPAFCRVALQIKPSQDSDIKAEIWRPSSGWNGKFLAVGNGG